jgi:succinoglycan biosynthesis transport protein ExoP
LRQQAADLSAKEAELLAHYGPTHPAVVNLRAQLRDVEASIGVETQRLAASIRNQYTLAQARVDSLEASLKQATGQTNIDDATAIRLHELERTAVVNKTLFEEFLKDAKVTQEQSTFEPQDIRVITPALPPTTPSSPNTKRFILVSLFVGLVLGVGGAMAREKLKSGFTTPKQVEDLMGLPLLASVNHLAASELKANNIRVHAFEFPTAKPLSRFSEAIRSLRSGIRMTDVDHPPKIIQVTSAVPREGKTTIALSLAASAAAADLKVLFIDADLRHPTASRLFDLEKQAGLVDLLLGEVEIGEVMTFLEPARYFVLGAGKNSQNPSDLLGSDRMKSIVAALSHDFDLVVIDTPPMGPVIDPAVVARLVDKVVLVVRWSSTARELVKQVADQLTGHPKVAGVVFNQVNERQASKYGRHAYSYYYRSRHYGSYYTE